MAVSMNTTLEWLGGDAPGHGRDERGHLTVGGAATGSLAEEFGTPLVVLDLDVLHRSISAFHEAGETHGVRISYGAKALLIPKLAAEIVARGIGIDICSFGEFLAAQEGGAPAEAMTLHGAGKGAEELKLAQDGDVARIVVDGLDELRRLASAKKCSADVILRLNTGIEAHTHHFVRTAGADTKFGMTREHEAQAMAILQAAPHLRFAGLHGHIGSQIQDEAPFCAHAEALAHAAARFAANGFFVRVIIVGGGFAVAMRPGESIAPVDSVIGAIAKTLRETTDALSLAIPSVEIEPGRALVAHAGTTLYTVLAVKQQFEQRYAIVDGSLADNPRPALYGAYHHVLSERYAHDESATIVCGRSCENDEMARAELPNDLRAGERVAMCTTGAYTYSMASNYNGFLRPAVVAIDHGKAIEFARRETYVDLFRDPR